MIIGPIFETSGNIQGHIISWGLGIFGNIPDFANKYRFCRQKW